VPKNEDGEFELILGNKQLLSMFFVVVILLGVFFIMGYIVGRNSAPLTSGEPIMAKKSDPKPLVVDSPAPAKQTPAPETEPLPAPPPTQTAVERPAEPKPEPPAAKTEPKTPATKPPSTKSEPAPKREVTKAEPRPAAPSSPAQSNQPVSGRLYLQLVATTKHDADAYVETLRKNSFPALDAEVPEKPGLFRVLVGPLAPGDVNKTKDELQSKGIQAKSAIPKKF